MMDDEYIVFDSTDRSFEFFKTYEEAEEYIRSQDYSEGISQDVVMGRCGIARITHRTKVNVIDRRENYSDDDGDNPWPYGSEFDHVGEVEVVEINFN